MNSEKLQTLIDTFFTHSVDLSESATIKVINDYIKESKKEKYVNDSPVQLTINGGRCTKIRLGSGYNDEHPIRTWYNKYSTKSEIKAQVNYRFKADVAGCYNENYL